MSASRLGSITTYRRHQWVVDMYVGLVQHQDGNASLKVANVDGLAAFMNSVNFSAWLAATSMPLPLGCSWDFSWVVGGTGNVRLDVRAIDDDGYRSGRLLQQDWMEAYDDSFFSKLKRDALVVPVLRKNLADIVAVRAQLNFGFVKKKAAERLRVLRPSGGR